MSDKTNTPAEAETTLTPEQIEQAKKDAEAENKAQAQKEAEAKKKADAEKAEAEAKKKAEAEAKATEKVKKTTFVCALYPDLMIKKGGALVRFNNGKFSTNDANLIDAIEKSASYQAGQIVIDDGKAKKDDKEE